MCLSPAPTARPHDIGIGLGLGADEDYVCSSSVKARKSGLKP